MSERYAVDAEAKRLKDSESLDTYLKVMHRVEDCGCHLVKATKKIICFKLPSSGEIFYIIHTNLQSEKIDIRLNPEKYREEDINRLLNHRRWYGSVTKNLRLHSGLTGYPDGDRFPQKRSLQVFVFGLESLAGFIYDIDEETPSILEKNTGIKTTAIEPLVQPRESPSMPESKNSAPVHVRSDARDAITWLKDQLHEKPSLKDCVRTLPDEISPVAGFSIQSINPKTGLPLCVTFKEPSTETDSAFYFSEAELKASYRMEEHYLTLIMEKGPDNQVCIRPYYGSLLKHFVLILQDDGRYKAIKI